MSGIFIRMQKSVFGVDGQPWLYKRKAESIIARQGSEEFFRKHSDYVIINNGDLKTTWKQIEEGIKLL